jgi:hypothetical protein
LGYHSNQYQNQRRYNQRRNLRAVVPIALLQDSVFNELFELAEIANFSPIEQVSYQNRLNYCRDLNNLVDTSHQEGWAEGKAEGIEEGIEEGERRERSRLLERQRSLMLRQLTRTLGDRPIEIQDRVTALSVEELEQLGEAFFDFSELHNLIEWLNRQ